MQGQKIFNVRVYGIIIDNHRENILLSDEYHYGMHMTKFPGGGLEFGEGPIEGLIRELKEETGIDMKIKNHFYTTDFFQLSAFNENHQIISIYYLVDADKNHKLKLTGLSPDEIHGSQSLRFQPLSELTPEMLTFPIDKKVTSMILEYIYNDF